MKKKKIPMRKCVATNTQHPKVEMFRIVRAEDGNVYVDSTGKKKGRGAYLSKDKEAILLAKTKKILDRHLEVVVDSSIYDELLKILGEVIG